MMVGNSMKSDVLPMLEAGGWGVFVPHGFEWEIESAPAPTGNDRFHEIENLAGLRNLMAKIDAESAAYHGS